jgi:hypothetical protein
MAIGCVMAVLMAGLAGRAASPGAAVADEGTLLVQTDPAGAMVYIDGRFVGSAPLTTPALPAGDHRVRVTKDGYLDNSRVVRITGGRRDALQVRLTARAGQTTQPSGLRIIVIEGEDGVNIIQQKTAVRPVVEVRDRNDLPVAGAVVVFSISGGGATFAGGATTTSVTTNAAGRAAVGGLNPVNSGSFQINVEASYQGQTATTTINQTNYATPAEAAQAAGAGQAATATAAQGGAGAQAGAAAGGAGAAGGGGLSALAITGIVGGAAAGTAVGLRAAGVIGGSDPCVFAVTPTSINAGSAAGSTAVNVSVSPSGCEPPDWTATSGAAFATLSPGSGSGNGSVTVNYTANTGAQRTGTVTVAGQTVTITQSAPCVFTVSPTTLPVAPSTGGSQTITISVAPAGCAPPNWTATSNASFLTVTPTSGSGNGTVTLSASANTGTASRTGTVTIAGTTLTVVQAGAAPPCNQQNIAGGDTPETRTIELGRNAGTFLFTYNTQNLEDRMLVIYEGRTLFDTGCVGTGSDRTQSITYSGTATQVQVQVIPNCRTGGTGTFWSFTVSCPQ